MATGFGAGITSGTAVGAGAGVLVAGRAVAAGTGVLAGAALAGRAGTMVGVGVVELQAKNSRANTPMTKIPALIECLIPPLLYCPEQRPAATARAGSQIDCSQL